MLADFVGVSVEYLVKGFTELWVLCFHSGFRVSRSERMTSEDALLKDSVCVDLFRKFVKASDYPIEGWRLAVKHSVCNHLLVVDPKSLEKRRRWNQTQAPRQAGVVVRVRCAKENVLVLDDILEKLKIWDGDFPDVVVSEHCEVMPMA